MVYYLTIWSKSSGTVSNLNRTHSISCSFKVFRKSPYGNWVVIFFHVVVSQIHRFSIFAAMHATVNSTKFFLQKQFRWQSIHCLVYMLLQKNLGIGHSEVIVLCQSYSYRLFLVKKPLLNLKKYSVRVNSRGTKFNFHHLERSLLLYTFTILPTYTLIRCFKNRV